MLRETMMDVLEEIPSIILSFSLYFFFFSGFCFFVFFFWDEASWLDTSKLGGRQNLGIGYYEMSKPKPRVFLFFFFFFFFPLAPLLVPACLFV